MATNHGLCRFESCQRYLRVGGGVSARQRQNQKGSLTAVWSPDVVESLDEALKSGK